VGGVRRVDCRPCGGCCGGQRSKSFNDDWYNLIRDLAVYTRAKHLCDVLIKYPIICDAEGTASIVRRYGLNEVKESERILSRETQYKAGYVIKRLRECSVDPICGWYIKLSLGGFYRAVRRLLGLGVGQPDAWVTNFVRGLRFNDVNELAGYLRRIVQNLLSLHYEYRHAGYTDVTSVACMICHEEFTTTIPLPLFIGRIVRHFREHGLLTIADVEAKAEKTRRRRSEKMKEVGKGSASVQLSLQALRFRIVKLLVDVGLISSASSGYVCRLHPNKQLITQDDVVLHIADEHPDLAENILLDSDLGKFIVTVTAPLNEFISDGHSPYSFYSCILCGRRFKSLKGFVKHVVGSHGGEVNQLIKIGLERADELEERGMRTYPRRVSTAKWELLVEMLRDPLFDEVEPNALGRAVDWSVKRAITMQRTDAVELAIDILMSKDGEPTTFIQKLGLERPMSKYDALDRLLADTKYQPLMRFAEKVIKKLQDEWLIKPATAPDANTDI